MRNPIKVIGNWISDRAVTRLDIVTLQHFHIVEGEIIGFVGLPPGFKYERLDPEKPETSIEALARLVS